MLASKGAPYFRSRFLDLVVEGFTAEVDTNEGKNQGLNEDAFPIFWIGSRRGIKMWFKNGVYFFLSFY